MLNDTKESEISCRKRYLTAIALGWTTIVIVSLIYNARYEYHKTIELAQVRVLEAYNKDVIYRKWVANHGGVYVPVTEETPSNPHLSHIPDRDITTLTGKKLTLINPAYMTRQAHELGKKEYGMLGHITSLNPIRPENKADNWETTALKLFEKGEAELYSVEEIRGEPYMRFMRHLETEERCLKCHAEQGYKIGDIRGGISVSMPIKSQLDDFSTHTITQAIWHFSFWLAGIIGVFVAGNRLKKLSLKRQNAEKELLATNHQLKANEEEREKLVKSLQFKNKELQDIVYTVSHDLRTPLVNIDGFSGEVIKDCEKLIKLLEKEDVNHNSKIDLLLSENIPESLRFITGSAKKMFRLLDGLLQVSRVGTVEIVGESIDMNKKMSEILAAVQYQVKENDIDITVESLPNCIGDEQMLDHVFSNLISNAIKYREPTRKNQIRVTGEIEGDISIYCVEDNGIGIAGNHQAKVFEIFHRLNPNDDIKGEGLGLTIVTRILDRLDGRIWVESEPDKGSKFFVSLPKA